MRPDGAGPIEVIEIFDQLGRHFDPCDRGGCGDGRNAGLAVFASAYIDFHAAERQLLEARRQLVDGEATGVVKCDPDAVLGQPLKAAPRLVVRRVDAVSDIDLQQRRVEPGLGEGATDETGKATGRAAETDVHVQWHMRTRAPRLAQRLVETQSTSWSNEARADEACSTNERAGITPWLNRPGFSGDSVH